jgi:hypothetical protein
VDTFIRVFTDKAREMGLPANSYQRIALYGCSNEPSFGGNTSLQQILDAEVVFMDYARSKGITVVSGNWAVGTINPDQVEDGLFHRYLEVLAANRHYMGVHEYTSYFLPFGVGAYPRSCLIDAACVQRDHWVTADYVRPARWFPSQVVTEELTFGEEQMAGYYYGVNSQSVTGFLPPYWHLFRSLWLDIYAMEHGIPRPTKIITEAFHDRLDDIRIVGPGEINPVVWLESRYGIREYMNDIRGAPSHCRLYTEYYYPYQTCAQSTMMNWQWWDEVADDTYHSANVFTWSQHEHWMTFNVDGTEPVYDGSELHRLLEDYARVRVN